MSEENINQEENQETTLITEGIGNLAPLQEDELTALKKRATLLGIQFHPAIGLDKLRDKVQIKLREGTDEEIIAKRTPAAEVAEEEIVVDATPEELLAGYLASQAQLTPAQLRNQSIKDANKLIRIRVTCMNPNKRDWAGEVITVANSVVGTFKKFIPFGASEGWHVPHIIYQALKERKCQVFVNGKDASGNPSKRSMLIAEFGIEVLPPLTVEEIQELGQRQLMAAGSAQ